MKKMKIQKIIVTSLMLALVTSLILATSGCTDRNTADSRSSILVKGSDTILPLSQAAAEEYMIMNKDSDVTIIGGGSGVGIAALIDGNTDIAMASREMKDAEITQAKENGVSPVETTIAYDGISVVVHPDNSVGRLTFDQVRGIFNGTISNWKDVGGSDVQITVLSRDSSSGTYEYFKKHVLSGDDYRPDSLTQATTGAIVQSVSQNNGAIGYIGIAYLSSGVKAIELSVDGTNFMTPTVESVKRGEYPLARALYYYTNGEPEGATADFIDYIQSDDGANVIGDVGYISVK